MAHPFIKFPAWPCLLKLRLTLAQFSLQCSVSCGVGTQRRKQVCQRLTAKGRRMPLSETMCRDLPGPSLVRACRMPECRSEYEKPCFPGVLILSCRVPMALSSTYQQIPNLQVRSQNGVKQQVLSCWRLRSNSKNSRFCELSTRGANASFRCPRLGFYFFYHDCSSSM